MSRNSRMSFFTLAVVSTLLSAPAFAGGVASPTIYFEPSGFSAIPTLSNVMLVALGLLLIVMAVRFVKVSPNALKTVAGVLLISGVLMGGYGVERSLATGERTLLGDDCTEGGRQTFDGTRLSYLENQCPRPMRVTDILNCQNPRYIDEGAQDCRVGTVISSGGERCNMPRCDNFE